MPCRLRSHCSTIACCAIKANKLTIRKSSFKMTNSTADCFDIEKVVELFARCLLHADDVEMDPYLNAYEEIVKFFQLMGTVFGFVSSDVQAKLDILRNFRADQCKEHAKFVSFKAMIEYEKEADLFKNKSYVSGSRTLLRLHRGLEFFYEFLTRAQLLQDTDSTQDCAKSAYNDTLSKYHPFLIRKGALVAMYAMPTKAELLRRVCQEPARLQGAIQKLPDMLRNTRVVFERTQQLYTLHDLHSLP